MNLRISEEWVPTQEEFDAFATISGDDNPIHLDPGFSARTRFGRPVAHGMLIYARLWAMLRRARPEGREISQTLMFPNPCFAGEPVDLIVEEHGENRFLFKAIRRADEAELLLGQAEVGE